MLRLCSNRPLPPGNPPADPDGDDRGRLAETGRRGHLTAEAIRHVEEGRARGKVVVSV